MWAAFCCIAYFYSSQQHIPPFIALAFLTAALIETSLYVAPGFRSMRDAFDAFDPPVFRALLLTASAMLPYTVYALGSGTFHWRWFGLIALLATIASAWFIVQPKRSEMVDILFLTFMAGVALSRVFSRAYVGLSPRVPAEILGQLMWIRVGVLSALSFRKLGGVGFGFLPTRKEWNIGVQQFLLFLPAGALLAIWLRFAQPHAPAGPWWRSIAIGIGTFFGILWVVALSEEFFFRGMLQSTLARLTRSRWIGLALASLAFGSVHLWFRHFPNWRMALLAAVAGVFYGIAYQRAKAIRASMVAHALVVTMWRMFFA